MPIYAYRCAACGHSQDLLRKFSDPPLANCPACGAARFEKQVTAAGFQLKGSGWYATDFRNPPAAPATGKAEAGKAEADKAASGKDTPAPSTGTGGTPAESPAPSPVAAAPTRDAG